MGAASVLLLVVLIVVGQISPADMSNHSSGEPAVKYPVDNKVVVIAAILTALGLITLIMVIVLCRCLKWCRKTSKKEQRPMGDEHIFGMD